MRFKRAQQEIAGFILIIVLVVVAMLIFMVISLRQNKSVEITSKLPDTVLSSVLMYTTECKVSSIEKKNVQDLIKSCFDIEKCENLDITACEYRDQILESMLSDILSKSTSVNAYEMNIDWVSENPADLPQRQYHTLKGACNVSSSIVLGATQNIEVNDGVLEVSFKVCAEKLNSD